MTNAIRTALATAEKISPRLAGELALPLFRKVGDPLPIRPDERATHDDARTETITVNGKRVITYQWGSEPRTVALVHGWRGRAAQFAALIRELRADGYSIVSFDAPANGASGGAAAPTFATTSTHCTSFSASTAPSRPSSPTRSACSPP